MLEDYKEWITSPERNLSQEKKDVIGKCLDALGSNKNRMHRSIWSRAKSLSDSVRLLSSVEALGGSICSLHR